MLTWMTDLGKRLIRAAKEANGTAKIEHPMADGLREVFQTRLQRKRDIDSEMKRILRAQRHDAPSN